MLSGVLLVELRANGYIMVIGAEGGTRTHTMLPSPDFESGVSTNFTTSAGLYCLDLEFITKCTWSECMLWDLEVLM